MNDTDYTVGDLVKDLCKLPQNAKVVLENMTGDQLVKPPQYDKEHNEVTLFSKWS